MTSLKGFWKRWSCSNRGSNPDACLDGLRKFVKKDSSHSLDRYRTAHLQKVSLLPRQSARFHQVFVVIILKVFDGRNLCTIQPAKLATHFRRPPGTIGYNFTEPADLCNTTGGHSWWCSWLRHCATNRKVAGSIPDGVTGIFHWHNPSGRTMALGLTQPLTEMSTRDTS